MQEVYNALTGLEQMMGKMRHGLFLLVLLAQAGLAKEDLSKLKENIPPQEEARRFYVSINNAANLRDYVQRTDLPDGLKQETIDLLQERKFNLAKSFPKCSHKTYLVTCGNESLMFTNHGLILNEVGIKFNVDITYLRNLKPRLDDLARSTLASGAKIEDPIAAAAAIIHELAYLRDFMAVGKDGEH